RALSTGRRRRPKVRDERPWHRQPPDGPEHDALALRPARAARECKQKGRLTAGRDRLRDQDYRGNRSSTIEKSSSNWSAPLSERAVARRRSINGVGESDGRVMKSTNSLNFQTEPSVLWISWQPSL